MAGDRARRARRRCSRSRVEWRHLRSAAPPWLRSRHPDGYLRRFVDRHEEPVSSSFRRSPPAVRRLVEPDRVGLGTGGDHSSRFLGGDRLIHRAGDGGVAPAEDTTGQGNPSGERQCQPRLRDRHQQRADHSARVVHRRCPRRPRRCLQRPRRAGQLRDRCIVAVRDVRRDHPRWAWDRRSAPSSVDSSSACSSSSPPCRHGCHRSSRRRRHCWC